MAYISDQGSSSVHVFIVAADSSKVVISTVLFLLMRRIALLWLLLCLLWSIRLQDLFQGWLKHEESEWAVNHGNNGWFDWLNSWCFDVTHSKQNQLDTFVFDFKWGFFGRVLEGGFCVTFRCFPVVMQAAVEISTKYHSFPFPVFIYTNYIITFFSAVISVLLVFKAGCCNWNICP